jgi:hypothetical protein
VLDDAAARLIAANETGATMAASVTVYFRMLA